MDIATALDLCSEEAATTRAINTARSYRNGLNVFAQFLESKKLHLKLSLDSLSMDYFIRFPSWLASQGYSKKTVGVYIASAKFFLDWLVINGTIRPNYSESLRYEMAVKQVNKKREFRLPRTPEKGALEKIITVLDRWQIPDEKREKLIAMRNLAILWFLISSGARNNELVGLSVKNIDLLGRKAVVIGKGNKERRVFFNNITAESIDSYWSERGQREKNLPAFSRHDKGAGKRILRITTRSVQNIVDDVAVLAGLDKGSFTPHYFRHAFAITMLRETHDLALVQDLLGHASPASTRIYAKIYPDDLEKAHKEVWDNPSRNEDSSNDEE
jgi:site-specific recombinase XerD